MRNIIKPNIKIALKLTFGHLGWISFITTTSFSHLALANENKKLNQNKLTTIVNEAGLNKRITLNEYWKNTKKFYPAWVVPQLENYVKSNGNRLMPEVQLASMKSSDGSVIPVMRLTDGGKSYTLQFFGEKNKYVKFNNVNLSEFDIARIDDVFTRIVASDYNLRKQAEALYFKNPEKIKNSAKQSNDFNFQKFPRITPELWKSLTKEQRVGYIIKMRSLHQSAVAVMASSNNKAKKGASIDLQLFYKTIFGEVANAQKTKRQSAAQPFSGQCIVAGYVGSYGPGENNKGQRSSICDVDLALKDSNYLSTKTANEKCAEKDSKTVACNPIIYGYPNGQPYCVDKVSSNFQQGTWFEGPCDKESRLTTTKVGDFSKKYSELSREEQLKAIELEQKADYKLTDAFLKGVLASKDPALLDAFINGKWTHALDTELVKIQNQFEDEITRSMQICSSKLDATGGKNDEPRQKDACDQLHRRWLFADRFVSQIRSKGCLDGSKYIWKLDDKDYSSDRSNETTAFRKNKTNVEATGSNLCQCANGKNVSFGERCELSAITSEEISGQPVASVLACSEKNGNIKGIDENNPCQCKDGKEPKPAKKGSFFSFISDNGDSKVDNNERTCDSDSSLMWLLPIGIIALIGVFVFNQDKNPKPVPAPQPQPVPSTPVQPPLVTPPVIQPTAPVCAAPRTLVGNNCICGNVSECALNQRMMDYTTCQCGPATPTAPNITCPDGSSSLTLAGCPKCSNGSYQTRMGCSEGGSGNNNGTGAGAGGVPQNTAR